MEFQNSCTLMNHSTHCGCANNRTRSGEGILPFDFTLTKYGVHSKTCNLYKSTVEGKYSVEGLRSCNCYPLVRLLLSEFNVLVGQLQVMHEEMNNVSSTVGGTAASNGGEWNSKQAATTNVVPPLSRMTRPPASTERMALRVYYKPSESNLYFLRRLPENMKRSDELFREKHELYGSDGIFFTARDEFYGDLVQLINAMKKTFPGGHQSGKYKFNVGEEAREGLTWVLSKVEIALSLIPQKDSYDEVDTVKFKSHAGESV